MKSAHVDEELAACCQAYLFPDSSPSFSPRHISRGQGKTAVPQMPWPGRTLMAWEIRVLNRPSSRNQRLNC